MNPTISRQSRGEKRRCHMSDTACPDTESSRVKDFVLFSKASHVAPRKCPSAHDRRTCAPPLEVPSPDQRNDRVQITLNNLFFRTTQSHVFVLLVHNHGACSCVSLAIVRRCQRNNVHDAHATSIRKPKSVVVFSFIALDVGNVVASRLAENNIHIYIVLSCSNFFGHITAHVIDLQ